MVRVRRPRALDRLGDRHAVVEASAGTGKTYLLEHLVVDLLLRRDAELEQILVVTFTEKATAELVQRVRAKLAELKDAGPDHRLAREAEGVPDEDCWLLDDGARQKLRRALLSFDRATITTIHGFCQRLLTEHAFLQQRLFDEEIVDEKAAFHGAFLEGIRHELGTDEETARGLQAWLAAGQRLEKLEQKILFECHKHLVRGNGVVFRPAAFDEGAFAAVLEAFPEVDADDPVLKAAFKANKVRANTATSVLARLAWVAELARGHRAGRSMMMTLAHIDGKEGNKKDLLPYIVERVEDVAEDASPLGRLVAQVRTLDRLCVPLSALLAHRILPRISARLEAQKRETGQYDFQDMLGLVARGLDGDGPRQRALLATVRGRYRHALIDEFQDTDDVQWGIFRRLFVEGTAEHTLTVIGDPKQAIYAFRGADVQTYLRACGELSPEPLYLTENFRSTAPLIGAYNAILDQGASPPFFRPGGIAYDHPVTCGRPDTELLDRRGNEAPPVVVLDVRSTANLLTWQVKQALLARMVEELHALLSEVGGLRIRRGGDDRSLRPSDIFVLTRTIRESREVGDALHAARIPFAYFKQERLFETVEAREVLDLLRAIAAPDDRSARALAWTTGFFGLSLPDLAACEDLPSGHPLLRLLYHWRGLAEDGDLEGMLASIVEESGLVCREVFLEESERALTNYLHVLEILQEEVGRRRCTIRELAQTLGSYVNGTRKPAGLSSDIQRLESDRLAVQIMTIHHAKGLEADAVFLYGGFWEGPRGEVRSLHDPDGTRVVRIGRAPDDEDRRGKEEREDEERRVLYVALTRARGRLYLPRYPASFKYLRGCYRFINGRLDELLGPFTPPDVRAHFAIVPVPCPLETPPAAGATPVPDSWQPPAALLAPDPSGAELRALAAARAGFAVTSYSAVKRRQGGFTPADAAADDPAANEPEAAASVTADLPPDELSRGRLSGSFLHEVLEELDFAGLRGPPPFDEWRARPAVEALFERVRRRHDRRPNQLLHAQRMIYTALTAPVRLGDRLIPGLATAPLEVRELEFLYPIPEAGAVRAGGQERWKIERGVVKGFVDLLFAHEGRAYVCDWKGDWLPSWEAERLATHAEGNYGTQARLYTVAALRFLGIGDEGDYRARFGGVLYCFLRGMRSDDPRAGVHFRCPSWGEVQGWQREMLGDEFWRLG
jgi:exodeoxyribonuclease V beta subunit